jgi:pilus assembly protein CpaB
MQARKIVLLFVALLIGGGTIMLARSMMTGPQQPATVAVEPTPAQEVLVAARNLPTGTLLKETDLKWEDWPTGSDMASFAIKGKSQMSDYVGAVVRQSLRVGEPLMVGRVVRKQEQGFMAAVLNPGMRAVSVPLTPVGGVAGFVFPGDRVDVILTHQLNRKTDIEPNGHKVSETMLTNVRVLALDQKTDDLATEPKIAQTATLEVLPKQAEKIALLVELGSLSLALRSMANGPDDLPSLTPASVALDAAARATGDPNASGDMTWDSDVSQVLAKPGNRNGTMQHIQIMRGKETTDTVFDLRQ